MTKDRDLEQVEVVIIGIKIGPGDMLVTMIFALLSLTVAMIVTAPLIVLMVLLVTLLVS